MATASLRTTLLLEISLWLPLQNNDPNIKSFLVSKLRSWFCSPHHNTYDPPSAPDPILLSVFAADQELVIGWHGFLCGILSMDLVQAQQ